MSGSAVFRATGFIQTAALDFLRVSSGGSSCRTAQVRIGCFVCWLQPGPPVRMGRVGRTLGGSWRVGGRSPAFRPPPTSSLSPSRPTAAGARGRRGQARAPLGPARRPAARHVVVADDRAVSIALTGDDWRLVAGKTCGSARGTSTRRELSHREVPAKTVRHVVFSPVGRTLATASFNRALKPRLLPEDRLS